ncbi:MAG: outer membrane beta-barrel protein [Bacteroidota bacterium]|nr:outer membrane beta-barrel protein [Bacteroidota bacterium]
MKKIVLLNIVLALALFGNEHKFLLSLKGTYTTSTRFLHNIDNPNVYSESRSITSNFGYGADVRWNILWDRFFLGFSTEKISALQTTPVIYPQFDHLRVPYTEGFELLAFELSGYYVVPISSEQIQFYFGGGFGAYDGKRLFSVANVNAETISSKSYMGIHVMTGIDYQIHSRIGLRFEIKFRDPHFDVGTKFDQTFVNYLGHQIRLPLEETVKVNLFGVNYVGGVVLFL